MSSVNDSGVMVAQSSLSSDFIVSAPKYPRPSGVGTDKLSGEKTFNVWGVIMAALIFIIVLSWFEAMRLIIQTYFIQTSLLNTQMWAYFTYTILATIFACLLIYICYKINQVVK